ncbi:MAG: hypothetical protein MJ093_07625 [Saccharofermentans sp.]|nr:hypothetical protein [Saccharofermentans sp.]
MSDNGSQQGGGINNLDSIITLIILVGLIFLCVYAWHGITWAFDKYIELLHVN